MDKIRNDKNDIDIEKLVKTFAPLLRETEGETEPIYIAKFILFLYLIILVNNTKVSAIALNALVAASDIVSFFPAIYGIYSAKPIALSEPQENIPPLVFPPPEGISKEAFLGFALLAIMTLLGFSNLQYLYAIYAALTYTFIPGATANLIKGLPTPCQNDTDDQRDNDPNSENTDSDSSNDDDNSDNNSDNNVDKSEI